MKTLLIHGYGTELYSTKSLLARSVYKGFDAWKSDIDVGRVLVFDWAHLPARRRFVDTLSPLTHIRLYRTERLLAKDYATLKALHQFILVHQPTKLVCHSLGAYLLYNYLNIFEINPCIGKIVLIQPDIDQQEYTRIKDAGVAIVVHSHTFDWSLHTSYFLNNTRRIGAYNMGNHSKSWYLNVHKDVLRDERVKKL